MKRAVLVLAILLLCVGVAADAYPTSEAFTLKRIFVSPSDMNMQSEAFSMSVVIAEILGEQSGESFTMCLGMYCRGFGSIFGTPAFSTSPYNFYTEVSSKTGVTTHNIKVYNTGNVPTGIIAVTTTCPKSNVEVLAGSLSSIPVGGVSGFNINILPTSTGGMIECTINLTGAGGGSAGVSVEIFDARPDGGGLVETDTNTTITTGEGELIPSMLAVLSESVLNFRDNPMILLVVLLAAGGVFALFRYSQKAKSRAVGL